MTTVAESKTRQPAPPAAGPSDGTAPAAATPSLPPGPRWPKAVQTVALWTAPVPTLRWARRRYGRSFTMRFEPMGTGVWLTQTADIKQIFTADPTLVHAGEGNAILEPVLGGKSVLLTDEAEHLRRRKLMLPMFHGEAVAAYRRLMAEVAAEEIASWRPGVMRLHPRMQRLTLEIILRAVIGVEGSPRADALRIALREVLRIDSVRMWLWLWPELGRYGPWKRYRQAQARADELLYGEIADRRADPRLDERSDILAMLVRARYEDGALVDDQDIRDQLITLLLAGHETTATGLAWAFERLMRHPRHLRRAVEAADARDEDALERVAKETLRVRPVVVDVARRLTADAEFGGRLLPKGTTIFPSILLAQEGPDWGDDAREFDPDRWERAAPPPYGWIPFGGGTRRCLGAAFAQTEMRIVLGEVLRRVELRPVTRRSEPGKVRHITNVPAFGTLARVRPRRRSA